MEEQPVRQATDWRSVRRRLVFSFGASLLAQGSPRLRELTRSFLCVSSSWLLRVRL